TTGEPIYDLNEDGLISQSDAIAVINQIGQPKDINNAVTDVDGNGIIEEADANAVIALIGTVVNE
ncbi:MAG: dockerin type I domain-containing protein, partial [Chloroflexota bacterium]